MYSAFYVIIKIYYNRIFFSTYITSKTSKYIINKYNVTPIGIIVDFNNDIESTIQFTQREVDLENNSNLSSTVLPVVSYLDEPFDSKRYSVVNYNNDPWITELFIKNTKEYVPASYIIKTGNNTDIHYKNSSDFPKLIHSCEVDPLYADKSFRVYINTTISLNRIKKYIDSNESLDNLNNYITTSDINSKINSPFRFSFWLQNKTNND